MGTLYSVATPIGNLADITLRALDVLKSVKVILCEDTRHSKVLLQHFGITTALESYHQHSSPAKTRSIISRLEQGVDMALVSDAGTPGISDPGSALVQAAIAAGIRVIPIPGATALIAALQMAGVDTSRFLFLGFLPHKKGRQTMFKQITNAEYTTVFYESPHRLLKTLTSLKDCGKQVVVIRELTKVYEECVRGTATEVHDNFAGRPKIQGECVVIVN